MKFLQGLDPVYLSSLNSDQAVLHVFYFFLIGVFYFSNVYSHSFEVLHIDFFLLVFPFSLSIRLAPIYLLKTNAKFTLHGVFQLFQSIVSDCLLHSNSNLNLPVMGLSHYIEIECKKRFLSSTAKQVDVLILQMQHQT